MKDDDARSARWGLEGLDLGPFSKLSADVIRIRWIDDYWDGPLSGMLMLRDVPRWFEYCGEVDGRRRYVVFELSRAEIDDEERWHSLFVENVGDHFTLDESGTFGTVKPRDQHWKFYEPYAARAGRLLTECDTGVVRQRSLAVTATPLARQPRPHISA